MLVVSVQSCVTVSAAEFHCLCYTYRWPEGNLTAIKRYLIFPKLSWFLPAIQWSLKTRVTQLHRPWAAQDVDAPLPPFTELTHTKRSFTHMRISKF